MSTFHLSPTFGYSVSRYMGSDGLLIKVLHCTWSFRSSTNSP